jgi:deazaflavin-dependent oxidoreductase (nitroreductase family)
MAARGVLNAIDGELPGSSWWRAMNERLLRDSCEAFGLATGRPGSPSTDTVVHWAGFIDRPTAQTWYRAHNASIVAAYLDHRDLAARENRVERFFLNVVLTRVLYAHALVAAPRLALGRLAPSGPVLGDPRRGTVDLFLAMGRVLPDEYPAGGDLEEYLQLEHKLGRVLDYAVIQPRLRSLYDWSARELGRPELADLCSEGSPAYAWPPDDRDAWAPPRLAIAARTLKGLTAPRLSSDQVSQGDVGTHGRTRMWRYRHVVHRYFNPLTRPFARRLPAFAVLTHRGRTSGRMYRTPINVFPRGDVYYFFLTYGSDVQWVKNVLAAGSCTIETRGRVVELVEPELITDPELRPAPPLVRLLERRIAGVTQYVRMRASSSR